MRMKSLRIRLITPLSATIAGGCFLFTEPMEKQLELTTDRASYIAESLGGIGRNRDFAFTIIARFANNSDKTVYLARCDPRSPYPMFGIGMTAEGESAYDGAWACVGHSKQFVVPPGHARIDTLSIRGPTARAGYTGEPIGAFSGTMRLSYEVQTCPGDGECRLKGAGRSAAFEVQRVP